jgi:hypothetical protein
MKNLLLTKYISPLLNKINWQFDLQAFISQDKENQIYAGGKRLEKWFGYNDGEIQEISGNFSDIEISKHSVLMYCLNQKQNNIDTFFN